MDALLYHLFNPNRNHVVEEGDVGRGSPEYFDIKFKSGKEIIKSRVILVGDTGHIPAPLRCVLICIKMV